VLAASPPHAASEPIKISASLLRIGSSPLPP
jgi:hypothetical protein